VATIEVVEEEMKMRYIFNSMVMIVVVMMMILEKLMKTLVSEHRMSLTFLKLQNIVRRNRMLRKIKLRMISLRDSSMDVFRTIPKKIFI